VVVKEEKTSVTVSHANGNDRFVLTNDQFLVLDKKRTSRE